MSGLTNFDDNQFGDLINKVATNQSPSLILFNLFKYRYLICTSINLYWMTQFICWICIYVVSGEIAQRIISQFTFVETFFVKIKFMVYSIKGLDSF